MEKEGTLKVRKTFLILFIFMLGSVSILVQAAEKGIAQEKVTPKIPAQKKD